MSARLYRSLRRPRGREVDIAIAACAIHREAALWTVSTADFECKLPSSIVLDEMLSGSVDAGSGPALASRAMSMGRRTFLQAAGAAGMAQPAPREIRVGVIGTGARGTYLIERSLYHPGVHVTAVCDIIEARAQRAQDLVQKMRDVRPEAYTRGPQDWRCMLERNDLDAVLVMTPWQQHAAQSVAAMRAGSTFRPRTRRALVGRLLIDVTPLALMKRRKSAPSGRLYCA